MVPLLLGRIAVCVYLSGPAWIAFGYFEQLLVADGIAGKVFAVSVDVY